MSMAKLDLSAPRHRPGSVKTLLFISVLLILIVACTNQRASFSVLEPTGAPTGGSRTAVFFARFSTLTPVPLIQKPTQTPTPDNPSSNIAQTGAQTPFPTPMPTYLLGPTPTGTPAPIWPQTPTLAPATPGPFPREYLLKSLLLADSLAIVSQFQARDPIPWDALITLKQETRWKYSHVIDDFQARWDLASLLAVRSPEDPNAVSLFAQILEDSLNMDQNGFDHLEALLFQNKFALDSSQPAPDLFGIGQPGRVLKILGGGNQGQELILAVRGSRPGDYLVYPLSQTWQSSYQGAIAFSIDDHNGNGQSEILLVKDYRVNSVPGGCGSHLEMWEWNKDASGGAFINIAPDVIDQVLSTDTDDCKTPWEFRPTEGSNADELVYVRNRLTPYQDGPIFANEITYAWDGRRYTWTGDRQQPDSDENIARLSADLANWPKSVEQAVGPASRDYFAFKLGIWLSLRGRTEKAVETLAQVRDHPFNTKYNTASRMAAEYLKFYPTQSLVKACKAVGNMVQESIPSAAAANLPVHQKIRTEVLKEAWGFAEPAWTYHGINDICPMGDVFSTAVWQASPRNLEELLRFLTISGISVKSYMPGDANGDGVEDWLVNLGLDADGSHSWLLLNTKGGVIALQLTLDDQGPGMIRIWNSFSPAKDEDWVNFIWIDDNLYPFRVVQHGSLAEVDYVLEYVQQGYWTGKEPARLGMLSRIYGYTIPASYQGSVVVLLSDGIDASYLWDAATGHYVYQGNLTNTQVDRLRSAENLLFVEHDVAASQKQLLELLSGPIFEQKANPDRDPDTIRPYIQYLLGLTYELSGDEFNAVRTYWTLWRSYPDNDYTYLAREKLVVSQP